LRSTGRAAWLAARARPGGLARSASDRDFASYLYWLHFANGTLQPTMGRHMMVQRLKLDAEHPMAVAMRKRLELVLSHVEARCAQSPFLAGDAFSAADIMSVFSLTTMRSFAALDLAPCPAIRAWLQERIGTREAYRRAMQKGDPRMAPMLR
jgi:glutathione S-transferase